MCGVCLFYQWLQTPLWPVGLCRHMTASVHQAPCATGCVYFGLEHLVIWELAVVFVLSLVRIHDLWGLCVCREPHGLACQYKSRSRGCCIFSVGIETICVFLLFSCYYCAVWGGKSLLERKCHDSTFVWSQSCAGSAEGAVSLVLYLKKHQPGLALAPTQLPESLVLFLGSHSCLSFSSSLRVSSLFSPCSPLGVLLWHTHRMVAFLQQVVLLLSLGCEWLAAVHWLALCSCCHGKLVWKSWVSWVFFSDLLIWHAE